MLRVFIQGGVGQQFLPADFTNLKQDHSEWVIYSPWISIHFVWVFLTIKTNHIP